MAVRLWVQHRPATVSFLLALIAPAVVVLAAPGVEFVFVPGDDLQPGGPSHDFLIAQFEIRNDQFAVFLNDALGNPTNERGQYMFFDVDTGDVLIHDEQTGGAGAVVGGQEGAPLMFDASMATGIEYDSQADQYQVTPGFDAHPVAGVSWYGAVKFCNWMTIDLIVALDERAYSEAPNTDLNGWHPVTITTPNWIARDLNGGERDALNGLRGFRLPMDGGDGAASPSTYNEWYKAAAWDSAGGGTGINHLYGFGRDSIVNADANYRCSHDPFEDAFECLEGGTTPVGFYDGVNTLADASLTADTANAYGLYDLSGNVSEWMQDRGLDGADRRVRGGSFRNSATFVQVGIGAERSVDSTNDSTGIRLVQSVVTELLVTPDEELAVSGPWGGPYDGDAATSIVYRVVNLTDAPIPLLVGADADWVTVSYDAPPQDLLPGGGFVDVTVEIAPQCSDQVTVGEQVATVSFLNLDDLVAIERGVRLTVDEPLTLTPSSSFTATVPFAGAPVAQDFMLTSVSDSVVEWSIEVTDPDNPGSPPSWVEVQTATGLLDGVIDPAVSNQEDFTIVLDPAGLDAGSHTAILTTLDGCTTTEFVRNLTLTVEAPLSVTPSAGVLSSGVEGGPFSPDEHTFDVVNETGIPLNWCVSVEPVAPETVTDWISIAPVCPLEETIAPNETAQAILSIEAPADAKAVGEYEVRLAFTHPATGFSVDRIVTLEVTELDVSPGEAASFVGPRSGPFSPPTVTYTLTNNTSTQMEWIASPSDGWIDISPALGVLFDTGDSEAIVVAPSDEAAVLPPGSYSGTVVITSIDPNDPGGAALATATRTVQLEVGNEAFALSMAQVPGTDAQPGGPVHRFRISRHEVTNAKFAAFLNDAELDGGATPRSSFMQFDPVTGVVTLPAGEMVRTNNADSLARITYDSAAPVGSRYTVETGFEEHPVTHVSWYGAVKFCNWLTIAQGMSTSQLAYGQGPLAEDWVPVAGASVLLGLRGFRLSLDGGATTADVFNEWYKAAAWIETDGENRDFGFGRDVIVGGDGNYRDSGDPFDQGTTPVGFFDGSLYNSGGGGAIGNGAEFQANQDGNENGYGLFDLSGNVAEWIHDAGDVPDHRAVRGGHFDTIAGSQSLRNDSRGSAPVDSLFPFIGFRVVQALPDTLLPLTVTQDHIRMEGEIGGPLTVVGAAPGAKTLTVTVDNPNGYTVDGLTVSITPSSNHLALVNPPPTQVAPGVPLLLELEEATTTSSPGASPAPPGDFVLIPGRDVQPGGPSYDYWIGRTEVTNNEFAAFLNDALANAIGLTPTADSDHMFFDVDTGSVYVNDGSLGEEGSAVGDPNLATFMYDAAVGRIRRSGTTYTVESGFESHPVVGVTWFGAIKYCNWLTLSKGIPEAFRAYSEATSLNLDGWHPVVVGDAAWLDGVDAAERDELIHNTLGYRLPMDDGAGGATPFNEWYKAAAWNAKTESESQYGFGRDQLNSTDANYLDSGDTQLDATTPVGFFDGVQSLFPSPALCVGPQLLTVSTVRTENGYGLDDASGNVAEWTQDFGNDTTTRALRGGSWRDDVLSVSLTTTTREVLSPATAADHIGFRVVRGTGRVVTVTVADNVSSSTAAAHFILDLREPLRVTPLADVEFSGVYGDDFAALSQDYTLSNHSDTDMQWAVFSDQSWLDVAEVGTDFETNTIVGANAGIPTTTTVTASTNSGANMLDPGTHTAVVSFQNVDTGHDFSRSFALMLSSPIEVSPSAANPAPHEYSGFWGGPFVDPLAERSFGLTSLVGFDLQFEIASSAGWLVVEPEQPLGPLSGPLIAGATVPFKLSVAGSADALPVGDLEATVTATFTDPANNNLSDSVTAPVSLSVFDPIVIEQPTEPWIVNTPLTDVTLPTQDYTLTNHHDAPIEVTVDADQAWLTVAAPALEVLPDVVQPGVVTVSFNASSLELIDGTYDARVNFVDTLTGAAQCRDVTLVVEETLSVTPFGDFESAGIAGGAFSPAFAVYSLTNVARDQGGPIDWEVAVVGAAWLTVSGAPSAAGVLADGETTLVVVAIDGAQTLNLPAGQHAAMIEFRDLTNGETKSRNVDLTVANPKFTLSEAVVASASRQPLGPDYPFSMTSHHTTNTEFVAFLNDALSDTQTALPGMRSDYMFFDQSSGDVYVNSAQGGVAEAVAGARTVLMFSPSSGGQIAYSAGPYSVVTAPTDHSDHPVTGVSWYGALKYCNWLTLDQGMLPERRRYVEGADNDLTAWRPVSIGAANWANRDLDDAEREQLVAGIGGFRLPMDDGAGNLGASTDTADQYNEWYKAAAWDGQQNRVYGFGGDVLTGADANFLDSGDAFDNATTPFTLYASNNVGLADMSGNAYQWMQGRFNTHPNSIAFRTIRGGSWNSVAALLEVDRRNFAPAEMVSPEIGFRVVAALADPDGDFDGSGAFDLADLAPMVAVCLNGPLAPLTNGCAMFDLQQDSVIDLRDWALLQNNFAGGG